MSGVLLYTDPDGHVCGGRDVPSEQRFDLVIQRLPNHALDPADIAWPTDERWTIDTHHAAWPQEETNG